MTGTLSAPRAAILAAAAGSGLLVARPLLLPATGSRTGAVIGLFAVLLMVGALWPSTCPGGWRAGQAVMVLAVGVAAFGVGRLLGGGPAAVSATARLVALNSFAAVAEEAFFRRLVYGALAPNGAAAAILGSGVLFAAVHFTVYGAWVLPLDLAAGLLLGWQRWATGSWIVPAATHLLANVLVVI